MNKTYRLIWSDARQTWIVAHEAANARGKPASRSKPLAVALTGALLLHSSYLRAIDPGTLPSGGQVVAGQASISQSGSAMTIQQGSDKAILNWNSFSIGSNASVNFLQPSSSAVALNRVIGSDPSAIYGSLTANGQVFLINPNGVLFGQGARVDVAGLVASTLNLRNEDFLAGNLRFTRDGATGSVVNEGDIYGHYVALLAPEVRNQGLIVARQGTVALAAGDAVTLNITGNRLVDVQVDPASISTLVENRQLIQAEEGLVILSAKSANNLLGKVINSGEIDATGISSDGGTVRLLASSEIEHSGTIDVSAGQTGTGGRAILFADLSNSNSKTILSGIIKARGGSVSGNGGFVETSASKLKIASTAYVDTRANNGKTGQWLLDPDDFTISATGDIDGATLSGLLNSNNVTIQTTATTSTCTTDAPSTCVASGATGTNNGDIFVNDTINWTRPDTNLSLLSWRNIEFGTSANITNDAGGFGAYLGAKININYGMNGTNGKAVIKQGATWGITTPTIVDLVHGGATTINTDVDNSTRDVYVGTTGSERVYVQLIPGTGAYGTNTTTWDYYAAAGGAAINLSTSSVAGSVTWDQDPTTLHVTGSPYALTYSSGLSADSSRYTFAAGNAANWTVTPATLTLTANNANKIFGNTHTFTGTEFTPTGLMNGETVGSVVLASAGAGAAAAVGGYAITIGGAAGGTFTASDYTITYTSGNLTVAAIGTPLPTPVVSGCTSPMFLINGMCSNPPTATPAPCMDGEINVGGQCVRPQRTPVRSFEPDPSCDVTTHYSPSPGMCAPRTPCADGLQALGGDATHDNTCAPPPPPNGCGPNEVRPFGYTDCQACPEGTSPSADGVSCQAPVKKAETTCKADEVLTESGCKPVATPIPCADGMTLSSDGGKCVPTQKTAIEASTCLPGSYKGVTGDCVSCPPGTFSSAGASECTPCAAGTKSAAGASACFADANADDWKRALDKTELPRMSPAPSVGPIATLAKMTNAQYIQYIQNSNTTGGQTVAQQLKAFSDACDDQIKQGVPKEKVIAYKEERLKAYLTDGTGGVCNVDGATCVNQDLVIELRNQLGLTALEDKELAQYPKANYNLAKNYGPCNVGQVASGYQCITDDRNLPSPTRSPELLGMNRWINQAKDKEGFISSWQKYVIDAQLATKDNYSESQPKPWASLDDFVTEINEKESSGASSHDEVQAYKEEKLNRFLDRASRGGCNADPRTIGCSRELIVAAREKLGLSALNDDDLKKYPSLGDYYDSHANDWKEALDNNTFPGGSPAPSPGPNPTLAGMTNAQYAQYILGAGPSSPVAQLKAFAAACDEQLNQGVPQARIDTYKEERLSAYLNTTGSTGPCADTASVCPNQAVVSELRKQMGLPALSDTELAKYPAADYHLAERFGPNETKFQIQSTLNIPNKANLTPGQLKSLTDDIANSLGIDPSRIQVQPANTDN